MYKNIISAFTVSALALTFLGMQTPSQAQSSGANAYVGNNNQISLQVRLSAWYENGALSPTSFAYFYDGKINSCAKITSLTLSTDAQGTLHSVAMGSGYFYGKGLPVTVEVDSSKHTDGTYSIGVKATDLLTGAVLYQTAEMPVVKGGVMIDPTYPVATPATSAK